MPKFSYFKVFENLASKEAEMKHLREVLPKSVKGTHFRDIRVLNLESDSEIDFESYSLTGWELDQDYRVLKSE